MDKMLAKAIAITSDVFKDTVDKGGHPYILHCLRVMNKVDQSDKELMTIAVLHDVLEDFPQEYSIAYFANQGFSDRVITALALLTHNKIIPYEEYIKAIAHNEDARKVKLADLEDNSNITRLKGVGKKDFDRMEKYHKAYLYLSRV